MLTCQHADISARAEMSAYAQRVDAELLHPRPERGAVDAEQPAPRRSGRRARRRLARAP